MGRHLLRVPYRDDLEALRTRVSMLTAERDAAEARLERARAALASIVADMAGLPAAAEIPWRSLHGGELIEVRFVNATAHMIELVWLSYDGKERREATIVPSGERTQLTYVAHLFRARDVQTGAVLSQRYVRAGDTRIVITDSSPRSER